jgi:hypothetical protein
MSAILKNFQYDVGSDLVEVFAYVEDVVVTRPQTMLDPEELGPAYCSTTLLWDEEITHDRGNYPTLEEIQNRIPWIPVGDWTPVPAIDI